MQQRAGWKGEGQAASTCIFIATIFYLPPAADKARRDRQRKAGRHKSCRQEIVAEMRQGRVEEEPNNAGRHCQCARPARSSHITRKRFSQSVCLDMQWAGCGAWGEGMECLKHKKYADNKNLLSTERLSSMQHAVVRPDRLIDFTWWRGKLFGACQTQKIHCKKRKELRDLNFHMHTNDFFHLARINFNFPQQ